MRIILLLIVLAFPLIDLDGSPRLTGVPLWIWLAWRRPPVRPAAQRAARLPRTDGAATHGEQSLLRGLLDSGRKVLAGILFLLPGVVSDLLALLLLALPLNVGRTLEPQPAAAGQSRSTRGDAIDGEYSRLD
jgi:UPF0716 protein FxsA